jgi:hypothetical protein
LRVIKASVVVLLASLFISLLSPHSSFAAYTAEDLIREIPEFEETLAILILKLPIEEKRLIEIKMSARNQWGSDDPVEIYQLLSNDATPGVPKGYINYRDNLVKINSSILWLKNQIAIYQIEIPKMKAELERLKAVAVLPTPTPTPTLTPTPTPTPTPIAQFQIDYVESHKNLKSEISTLIKRYPSQKKNLAVYLKMLDIINPSDLNGSISIEKNLNDIRSKIEVIESIINQNARTITCVKAKKILKVRDLNPKCPTGYKKV